MSFRKGFDLLGKAMRETSHAMNRLTKSVNEEDVFRSNFSRHRQLMPLKDKAPVVADNCFIAPNAAVIGEVTMLDGSSLWYKGVLRADKYAIKIGQNSNIQDHAVIQCVVDNNTAFPPNTVIGKNVTIGHGALLTSCLVGDECLIGQGSVVCEGCTVGNGSIIAASAVLPPQTHVPAKQMWAGNPAKYVRDVTDAELKFAMGSADHYKISGSQHQEEYNAFNNNYKQNA